MLWYLFFLVTVSLLSCNSYLARWIFSYYNIPSVRAFWRSDIFPLAIRPSTSFILWKEVSCLRSSPLYRCASLLGKTRRKDMWALSNNSDCFSTLLMSRVSLTETVFLLSDIYRVFGLIFMQSSRIQRSCSLHQTYGGWSYSYVRDRFIYYERVKEIINFLVSQLRSLNMI
jgi:hypothetical protein